jgi:hypothetical protein
MLIEIGSENLFVLTLFFANHLLKFSFWQLISQLFLRSYEHYRRVNLDRLENEHSFQQQNYLSLIGVLRLLFF